MESASLRWKLPLFLYVCHWVFVSWSLTVVSRAVTGTKGDWARRILTGIDGLRGWNSAIERRSRAFLCGMPQTPPWPCRLPKFLLAHQSQCQCFCKASQLPQTLPTALPWLHSSADIGMGCMLWPDSQPLTRLKTSQPIAYMFCCVIFKAFLHFSLWGRITVRAHHQQQYQL